MSGRCRSCLAVVPEDAKSCPDCGGAVRHARRRIHPWTVVAALVILFIGGFWYTVGVDRLQAYIDALVTALR